MMKWFEIVEYQYIVLEFMRQTEQSRKWRKCLLFNKKAAQCKRLLGCPKYLRNYGNLNVVIILEFMDKKSLELGKSLLICYLSMCILLSHFCTLITINLSESWYLFIGTVLCSLIASIKSYQLLVLLVDLFSSQYHWQDAKALLDCFPN